MLENQLNVIALFIVITSMLPLCIIYAKTNEYLGKKKEIRAFKGMLVSFMVYALVDLRCITDHFPNAFPRLFGCFVMSLGFAAMSTTCYFWFLYVFSSARVKYTSRRIIHKIATIPMVLLVIMLFTPLHVAAYDVTETGIVLRPMLMVVIILDYLYLLCATVISIYKTLHEKNKSELKKYRSQIFYILFYTLSGIAVVFVENTPIIELCMLPIVLQNFVDLQDSKIYTDALTKLGNRSRMDEYFREEISTCGDDCPLTVIMVDLDYFKSINDILGHDEGDKVLAAFSRALRHVLTAKQALAARWGGDEFVIAGKEKGLGDNLREQIIKDLEMNNELPFIPLFSLGVYQCFSPNMTIEQVLQKADERLYKDKAIQHENKIIFHQKLREIKKMGE